MLALQIAVVAQKQNQDADGQERRAERSPDVVQRVVGVAIRIRQRRVEPEELRYRDAYGRKGQRSP